MLTTNVDGYLYLYPKHPERVDDRFRGASNPKSYTERWDILIKPGELLQEVYVSSDDGEGWWQDRPIERIDDYFPNLLPLKDLVFGREGQMIQIAVKGQTFNFQLKQSKEKFGLAPFEETMEGHLERITLYPEKEAGECFVSTQEFNGDHYKAVVGRLHADTGVGEIPPSCVYDIFLDSNKKTMTLDNTALKRIFKKKKLIGGGGEGAVFEVRKKCSSQRFKIAGIPKALKITQTHPYPKEVVSVINHLLNTNQTPHLTRVDRIFKVPTTANPLQVFEVEGKDFVKAPLSEGEKPGVRSGLEMELLEGDIEKFYPELSPAQQMAIMIQAYSAMEKLNQYRTDVSDFKLRNIFYKTLGDETFKGKRMADYDYWKYTLSGHDFYVPRMEILIKLGDYDGWSTTLFTENPDGGHGNAIELLASSKEKSIEELKEMFPVPTDPTAKILEMD